jgi:hypothetical protein
MLNAYFAIPFLNPHDALQTIQRAAGEGSLP